ncbi:hypothetical protein DH2020_008853 [Rehmannia glutinosa]|uniref:Cystatin domain-containing protein n=1 Tax=Rehmannia glutinosa TaxID=99300 RepID=A0ABR0X8C1_REHGL
MALKSCSLPLAILTIMVALVSIQASAAVLGGRKEIIVGDYKPIKNLTDPWVVEIARFAVAVQNHSSNSTNTLEFVSIVKGYIQVSEDLNDVSAKDGNGNGRAGTNLAKSETRPTKKNLDLGPTRSSPHIGP